ncbi:hypothetical protein CC86DRAFT_250222, partial [Ophiobolus disseminans]
PKCRGVKSPVRNLTFVSVILNVVVDFYLLLIPLRPVFNLRLPRKRKTGVMLIFLSGTVGCVMSILNAMYRRHGFEDPSQDTFYSSLSTFTVIVLETATGVSVPCMSSCAKVFSRWSGVMYPFFHTQRDGYQ